jgi:segregation and condensation protein A
MEEAGKRSYARVAPLVPDAGERPLAPLDPDRLLKALQKALDRLPPAPAVEASVQEITIDTKAHLIRQLLVGREEVSFDEVLEHAESRIAVVLSFLALLELLKAAVIDVRQEERFGEIMMYARAPVSEPVPGEQFSLETPG